ncbi:hypothetical protein [Vibrio parahaemolyticus]|uniref:hypothetical protein n=1 Tax=Vibrio parahaemolyticus TaxID=670 RepID=UPI00112154E6|nr:hypothetical protein [Vibrio parahaemolyticus]TOJ64826.1 hypothetical protein CGI34_18115 [Vibrio parahaemolyticus]
MRHQSLSKLCLIEASGQFLTDFFPFKLLDSRRDKLAWIQEHKWEMVENEPDECVLNFIENLAMRLEAFVQIQLANQQVKIYAQRRYQEHLEKGGTAFETGGSLSGLLNKKAHH